MFPQLLKGIIERSLSVVGFEIRRSSFRSYLIGVLQQVRNVGLSPNTVVDVGAAYGKFTLECQTVFPDSKYLLIEPLREYRRFLTVIVETARNTDYIAAAATGKKGEIAINVHPDLVGSSLYLEGEDSGVNGVPQQNTLRTTGVSPWVSTRD